VRRIEPVVNLDRVRQALAVIDLHQALAAKADTAFPDGDDADPVGYSNLYRFGVKVPDHVTWDARTVRESITWFTRWESARIVEALRTVRAAELRAAETADQDTAAAADVTAARAAMGRAVAARDIADAATRLIRRRRLGWLFAVDFAVSHLNPQRVLTQSERQALRLALRDAGETATATAARLEEDFNAAAIDVGAA
jgi:hypothetical protein